MLNGLMTQQEISDTMARWDSIGQQNSKARLCAFSVLCLTNLIDQARIPNQLRAYETAHYEQIRFNIMAIRDTYAINNRQIEAGMKRLQEVGLLDCSFDIPNLSAIEKMAVKLINQRGKVSDDT